MNIGDKVTLKADSQWANPKEDYLKKSNPLGVVGIITEILSFDPDDLCIDVTWEAFYDNCEPIMNTYSPDDLELVKMNLFTKSMLKSGDRVELRNGVLYVVLTDSRSGILLFSTSCYNSCEFTDDLLSKSYSDSDVMKVYTVKKLSEMLDLESDVELIWERPTYSEMFDYIEGLK